MSEPQQSRAQQLLGDFAPKMVSLTDEVLFGDIWERAELSPRDRSLITVAALIATGSTDRLPGHLATAQANGLTETEPKEVITHLAFYAGWPKAMSALTRRKASPQRLSVAHGAGSDAYPRTTARLAAAATRSSPRASLAACGRGARSYRPPTPLRCARAS